MGNLTEPVFATSLSTEPFPPSITQPWLTMAGLLLQPTRQRPPSLQITTVKHRQSSVLSLPGRLIYPIAVTLAAIVADTVEATATMASGGTRPGIHLRLCILVETAMIASLFMHLTMPWR